MKSLACAPIGSSSKGSSSRTAFQRRNRLGHSERRRGRSGALFTHQQQPGRIVHGSGALAALGNELRLLDCRRALIVTSPTVATSSLAARVALAVGPVGIGTFGRGLLHVPMSAVKELAEVLKESQPDVVVALGGGSALDTAKGAVLAAAVTEPFEELHRDFLRDAQCVGHGDLARIVTIPTTLTGAERTGAFSIVDGARKLNYTETHVRPMVVIQDPDLLPFTPRRVLMESGMNSMAQSIEALLSGSTSPLLQPLHMEALRLNARYLPIALNAPDDARANDALLTAIALAMGLGGRTVEGRNGIIHSLTHAIAGASHAPHGAIYGIVIPEGMRFNGPSTSTALGDISEAIGGRRLVDEAAIATFVQLRDSLGLPSRLRELGVSKRDLPHMADLTMLHFATAQNVRTINSASEVLPLLMNAY
jgi:alcohol dehydrogenase class IV